MRTEQIEQSREIHRQTGPTFYLATRFLPERTRHPTYVLYAFLRTADEIVDRSTLSETAQRDRLEELRAVALGDRPTEKSHLRAFQTVRERHDIPARVVEEFIDAMLMDITVDRYETMAQLERYMGGSAAAVGEMMTAIMGADNHETARPHARALGEALQLTNFVRDVREDVRERDRIYLPADVLHDHGTDHAAVERLEPSPELARATETLLERTEDRYRLGVAGIEQLPRDCQFPVLLAAVLYAEYHRLIRARHGDVVTEAPSLSRMRKLACLARTRWHWQWTPEPATVFHRVAAVPPRRAGGDRERDRPLPA